MSTTSTGQPPTPDAERVQALIDTLRGFGRIRSPGVEAAFRAVPRHLFLPGVDLDTAYAPKVVVTKRAADGSALSSASGPVVVAGMLEQLDVQPGHRVLEIGAGTGINAALLAELAGPGGHVTTIDIDPEVTDGARTGLTAAGYTRVEVVCADGAAGHPPGTPYDRIIITAGAWDLAPAWWQQLTAGGRLVVPLRLHGSGLTRSIALDNHRERDPDEHELGVTAHGPRSRELAHQLTEHLRAWNHERPSQPHITAHPTDTPEDQLAPGHRIDKPSALGAVSW